ncbi:hypothetical protein FCN80_23845 [Martelella alba]|uniref:Uncharacterized protein n=2 Tax=Martelella alba TaxID=2590451 RepID=A0ABY2SEM9_9HYPH|nr:hypothetical protein FCN80_23845 [Martelella alba]
MHKYVIFIKNKGSMAIPREFVTPSYIKEMKKKGFRKHHIEIEANNEKEAFFKINEHNEDYLNSLRELSGSAVICGVFVIIITLTAFFKS